jgi:hypothetical protein
MSLLPGWDSVDTTDTIAHYLHIAAVVVLGILFIAEGMALSYDFRNHSLARIAAIDAEAQRKRAEDAAEERRRSEVERLQKQVAEADKKVGALQSQNIARRLTGDQTEELVKALSPFKGQKFYIFCTTNAWDGSQFAKDFFETFKQAAWEPTDQIRYGMVVGGDAVGVEVMVNPQMADAAGHVSMPSVIKLIQTLAMLRIMPAPTLSSATDVAPGTIYVRIGRIPPPP